MFELLRKFSLFMLLFVVALSTYLSGASTTDWRRPLSVRVYPINGDQLGKTTNYINSLTESDYDSIETFMSTEAERFGVSVDQPVEVKLGPQLRELPPLPPASANPLSVMFWSLNIRWWAWNATRNIDESNPDIKLFLIYFDPIETPALSHSVGLRKGLLGIVNVFASQSQTETNSFVITHELLHTLGATDKYGGPDNLPIHPVGYADPGRTPLYPQSDAEIMGGRIPVSQTEAVIPFGLQHVLVGPTTAQEIRWLD